MWLSCFGAVIFTLPNTLRFPIFWHWAYMMKVIPETYMMKAIPETYMMKVIPETRRGHLSLLYQFLFFSLKHRWPKHFWLLNVVALSMLDEAYHVLTKFDIYVLHCLLFLSVYCSLMVYHEITIATLFKRNHKRKSIFQIIQTLMTSLGNHCLEKYELI